MEQPSYIEGFITHSGSPVEMATIELADKYGNVIDKNGNDVSEYKYRNKSYSNENGYYKIPITNSLSGRFKLLVKSMGGHATLHNSLISKNDVWVDLPIGGGSKKVNIELISWAEKIGYTGP